MSRPTSVGPPHSACARAGPRRGSARRPPGWSPRRVSAASRISKGCWPDVHGLILAGGEGSRLAAGGIAVPKPLVEVAGKPQIVGLLETLAALGCSSLTCAVRADFPAVRRLLDGRSEEHTSELQSLAYLVCRLLLEKKKKSADSNCPTDTICSVSSVYASHSSCTT